jgi:hypothetical protein
MKISKIIFTIYFSIIGFILLSLMVMGFVHKDKKNIMEEKFLANSTINIDKPFRHLWVDQGLKLAIKQGDTPEISFYAQKDTDVQPIISEVRNDTLFLALSKNSGELIDWAQITVNGNISITGKGCSLNLTSMKQGILDIDLINSQMYIHDKIDVRKFNFKLCSSSEINGSLPDQCEINLDMKNSNFMIYSSSTLKLAEGSVTDSSEVSLPAVMQLRLDVDQTSKLRMY